MALKRGVPHADIVAALKKVDGDIKKKEEAPSSGGWFGFGSKADAPKKDAPAAKKETPAKKDAPAAAAAAAPAAPEPAGDMPAGNAKQGAALFKAKCATC